VKAPLGSGDGKEENSAVDRNGLRQALGLLKKQNDRYFALCFMAAIMLFVGLFATVFIKMNEPSVLKGATGIFGISAGALAWRMFKMWERKTQIEFFMHLTPNVDDKTIKTVISVLSKKL